jgi:hypothetical protein
MAQARTHAPLRNLSIYLNTKQYTAILSGLCGSLFARGTMSQARTLAPLQIVIRRLFFSAANFLFSSCLNRQAKNSIASRTIFLRFAFFLTQQFPFSRFVSTGMPFSAADSKVQ